MVPVYKGGVLTPKNVKTDIYPIRLDRDVDSAVFPKLFKKVLTYNKYLTSYFPKVLKNVSNVNNRFISASNRATIQKNKMPQCTCGGKVISTLAHSYYTCIECDGFILISN